jgi:hypothetical protein
MHLSGQIQVICPDSYCESQFIPYGEIIALVIGVLVLLLAKHDPLIKEIIDKKSSIRKHIK